MASSALAKLAHDSSEKLPPYDKLPPVPVDGFCADSTRACDPVRLEMLQQWPKAWAGDYQSQRNVAYMQSERMAGVPYNPVQGCAWRMVILASGHTQSDSTDIANYNFECRALTPVELVTAKASAGQIFKTIAGNTLPDLPPPS
ncbi:hypothetical protein ABI_15310 [Asticcacaulis biprosthecium C19]|uniref:Uncharacterized protein n=1 Tax=Asticcacaulis biprosthecium C19 TaxID=715226 RepID=F4QJA8_9CAUL|nr:hypothetical protein ABI_15310 [Asticcacaulis biprosthecium C19]